MKGIEMLATEHMRTQDLLEAEPVRVERAYMAGFRKAREMAASMIEAFPNQAPFQGIPLLIRAIGERNMRTHQDTDAGKHWCIGFECPHCNGHNPMVNQYTPWGAYKLTEGEYFKMRYLESQKELHIACEARAEGMREAVAGMELAKLYLEQAKARFAPATTNSFVDEHIADLDRTIQTLKRAGEEGKV